MCRASIQLRIRRKVERRDRDHLTSSVVAKDLNATAQGNIGRRIGREGRAAEEEVAEAKVFNGSRFDGSVLGVQAEGAGLQACGWENDRNILARRRLDRSDGPEAVRVDLKLAVVDTVLVTGSLES